MADRTFHPETLAIHAGQIPDPATGARALPIYQTASFVFDDAEHAASLFNLQTFGNVYTRLSNPTVAALEERCAALEGGRAAIAAASGMAAEAMALMTMLEPGDHVVAASGLYGGSVTMLSVNLAKFGIDTTFVDASDPNSFAAAITPATRAVFAESLGNPSLQVLDIAAVADIAHAHGVALVVDNTVPSPYLCNPIALGADVVVHSATKYLGGHSDAMGGIVISAKEDDIFASLRDVQREGGAVLSPFDSWLIQRGLHTLVCRVNTQCASAMTLASALNQDPAVAAVHYPGLASDPGHALATAQMADFGAMLSLRVNGDAQTAMQMAARLKLVRRATSLGGTHTLIEHRASIEGAQTMAPPNLLRLSVGLEHPLDILEDLQQALHG